MKTSFNEIKKVRGMLDIKEAKFLYNLAKETVSVFGEKAVLCEIGSFCGKSAVSIGSALKEEDKGALYAIDWHQGSPTLPGFGTPQYKSTYEEYVANLTNFGVIDKVVTIKKKSEDAVADIPAHIHFLWIDGLHEYAAVKADYKNYQHKLAQGGYLLFHDACWTDLTEPFQLISEEVLDNKDYNLYALIGHTIVFKKEKNTTPKWIRNLLRRLCVLVSGSERKIYKKGINFILYRITSYYTNFFHKWRHI